MSTAQRIFHGAFGRIALLHMDAALVPHAHSECHVLLKAAGADSSFNVKGQRQPLTNRTAVLVNAWEPHGYNHEAEAEATLILALYIEPSWLAQMKRSLSLSARPDFFQRPCVELTPHMRSVSEAMVADMMSPGLVPRERVEELLFELLIGLFERFSEWRHLTRMYGPAETWMQDARIRHAREWIICHLDQELYISPAFSAITWAPRRVNTSVCWIASAPEAAGIADPGGCRRVTPATDSSGPGTVQC